METINDVAKACIRDRIIKALTEEKLPSNEAAMLLGVIPAYISMTKNPKGWDHCPPRIWEIFQKWVNSGMTIRTYSKILDLNKADEIKKGNIKGNLIAKQQAKFAQSAAGKAAASENEKSHKEYKPIPVPDHQIKEAIATIPQPQTKPEIEVIAKKNFIVIFDENEYCGKYKIFNDTTLEEVEKELKDPMSNYYFKNFRGVLTVYEFKKRYSIGDIMVKQMVETVF
jgi:hypothetical protein